MTAIYGEHVKVAYWGYFSGMVAYRPARLTERRMSKLKAVMWNDSGFWGDIIYRHGGGNPDPAQMSDGLREHCVSNFYGMLMKEAVRRGMIK